MTVPLAPSERLRIARIPLSDDDKLVMNASMADALLAEIDGLRRGSGSLAAMRRVAVAEGQRQFEARRDEMAAECARRIVEAEARAKAAHWALLAAVFIMFACFGVMLA